MQVLLYATILLIATFLWGYAYYKKDYKPLPRKTIVLTFGAGLFSMLPLFGYKYLYQNFLPTISDFAIFKPIIGSAVFGGIFMFVANLLLLSIVLLVLSGILSLILTRFNIPVLNNIKMSLKEEPLGFIAVSLIIGILITLERTVEIFSSVSIIYTLFGSLLFLTVIEEYIKHLITRFVDDKKLRDIDDAITLSIMVGLAFAFIESIIYSIAAADFSLVMYRIVISIPIHVVSSGIFGYFYGLAHFSKPIIQKTQGDKAVKWIHKVLGFKKETAYKEEQITKGLFWATLFHATNNILLEINLAYLTIPVLVFGLLALNGFYDLARNELWLIKPKRHKLKKV